MTIKTFLIDLVEAKLPTEFGFPELGVDREVLFNMLVKASIWEEDIIFNLRDMFCKQNNFYQGDRLLDQFWEFRKFVSDVIKYQDKGLPVYYGVLLSAKLDDSHFGCIKIYLPE